jgi:hypothetical protein
LAALEGDEAESSGEEDEIEKTVPLLPFLNMSNMSGEHVDSSSDVDSDDDIGAHQP